MPVIFLSFTWVFTGIFCFLCAFLKIQIAFAWRLSSYLYRFELVYCASYFQEILDLLLFRCICLPCLRLLFRLYDICNLSNETNLVKVCIYNQTVSRLYPLQSSSLVKPHSALDGVSTLHSNAGTQKLESSWTGRLRFFNVVCCQKWCPLRCFFFQSREDFFNHRDSSCLLYTSRCV